MANIVPSLETERLLLKPLALDDAPAIQAIFPQWEIVRFLASHIPWPYPPDGAESFLRTVALPGMAAGTEWHWSLRQKAEPERLIGVISLLIGEKNNRGFWIAPEWRGQGLMSEAVVAVTDFWFEVLGRDLLRAPKAVENIASRRISQSSGMRMVGVETHSFVSGEHPAEIWEITAAEWRAHRAAG
ncbi:N-acetyltransferase [Bosea sp. 62]|uniref:GNAT family N-acetyltransferase n=1 Tax=unclassified Bosea (in: a-proteobacteria) TaxID=2653178 RepID=UPI001251463C|nr:MULTISPECIES: GNAT family N-acetyltransferase [unclassified Bosea (in: a-proteobacteria)]CAD5298333.1 N-acetyltransferase [Bosea sp. 21B]CAD5298500.1 N-acetyltransferase [Bosea sp. 46]VVT61448.1 Protein N-acetyltransferase, RimJ/RimL family [Bosea sp. EC-HK365B]VXC82459.1 N-acetyltransferase [Bosea sp. 62]VXC84233.1 N-acetyltransferase [Bosea sp. 29B]